MSRSLKGFTLIGVLAVLFTALAFTGCSVNTPTAPESDSLLLSSGKFLSGDGAQAAGMETILCETSQQIPAKSGGTIEIVHDSYVHEFTVAPSSIDRNTQISIKTTSEMVEGKNATVFEFGPDGLVFAEAATLTYQMDELNTRASAAYLYYYDTNADKWILQGSASVYQGEVEFEIYHFSKYAISD